MGKNENKYPSKDIIDKYGVDEEYDDGDNTPGVFDHNSGNRTSEAGAEHSSENEKDEETSTVGVFQAKKNQESGSVKEPVKPPNNRRKIIAFAALSIVSILCMVLIIQGLQNKQTDNSFKGEKDNRGEIVVFTESPAPTAAPTPASSPARSMGPFSSGLFTFLNGETIAIPEGFVDTNAIGNYQPAPEVDQYYYDFYNKSLDMYITLSESLEDSLIWAYKNGFSLSPYRDVPLSVEGNLIDALFDDALARNEAPVYKAKTANDYVLSGNTDGYVYYSRVIRVDGVIYSVDFLYPLANRSSCDRIVEMTEASFSGMRAVNGNVVSSIFAPTLSDLESMVAAGTVKTKSNKGSILVLPTEQQMLNAPFRAHVDNGKNTGSIYIMPRNQAGHGYTGTVTTGTEVWIVAQTNDFYFFVTDDGQMGWNGKSFFS